MKKLVFLLLCLALTLSAGDRVVESGSSTSATEKGSYTLVSFFNPMVPAEAFGMAIQDNVADRLWISSWGEIFTYEYAISTGIATGNSWPITNDIDANDMAWCDYAGGAQFLIGDYSFSNIGVFDASGAWVRALGGPASFSSVIAVGAGHNMIYTERGDEIAWGSYTGTESSVTWNIEVSPLGSCYGMAVWGDYLFASTGDYGVDNIFIFEINSDGSLNLTPVWSCQFIDGPGIVDGGIDYDGTYLYAFPEYIHPENGDFMYILDINWSPSALENSTWGQIKAEF